ncbi:uncharacterized protein LOC122265619 isoform X2 [Penaeus japonicus]|nr:uncharacterized protein LOC122265619 isoform X2 [Penaeus japonicus]
MRAPGVGEGHNPPDEGSAVADVKTAPHPNSCTPHHALEANSCQDTREKVDPLTVRLCVGGFGRVALRATVSRLRWWSRIIPDVGRAFECGGRVQEFPGPVMSKDWVVTGDASFQSSSLHEVCSSYPRYVLIQPAGTYSHSQSLCHAMAGALVSTDDLLAMNVTSLQFNNICSDSEEPLTWLDEKNGTILEITPGDECPAWDSSGEKLVACVRRLECSICKLSPTVMYTLYGHTGRFFDYTYFIDSNSSIPVFQSKGSSRIEREDTVWVLSSSLHRVAWRLEDAAVPIGRRMWRAEGQEVVLTLTKCLTTQFTCDDGQCISQTLRCDDILHCQDMSDEFNCHVVEKPSRYDVSTPPPLRPGENGTVSLAYHIDVYHLSDITAINATASMDVGITLTWYDPRLKFRNLKPDIKNYFPCELVWTPAVQAVSGHGDGTVLDTNDYEKFCYAYNNDATERRPLGDPYMGHEADGVNTAVEVYLGVLATVPCQFQLQLYPFDTQLCNLSFVLTNSPWSRVFDKALPGNHVPYLNARRSLLEYVLEDQTTAVGWLMQAADNNTYFVLSYHLRRLYGYHIMNSYFPTLLMFVISYATFYFQLDDFTNRIMISLTAQLVLAALFSSTTRSSVKTPYLKLIDVWFAVIITSCFLIIVFQTLINVIFHSKRLPGFVYKAARFPGPLNDTKKVFPLFIKRSQEQAQREPPGCTVARRYNGMARVFTLSLVTAFVALYILMALRVL